MTRLLGTLLLAILSTPVQATEYMLMLGGGATPESSEISIEKNVDWLSRLLYDQYSVRPPIMFAAGKEDRTADVRFTARQSAADVDKLALARIFGGRKYYLNAFRKNAVATHPDPATRENALRLLEDSLDTMKAGDSLFFIYNGHGGKVETERKSHHLRLWNRTRLTVEDMVTSLTRQPADTSFRFVLPQCYSGPFVRIIHEDLSGITGGQIRSNRCGFIAAPAHRESEGCTPDDNESNYVDYSTYFFAALQGKTRSGKPLAINPDQNLDGVTDLSEAHYYTVLHGFSRDVPRTTSEYFLESWQPWYLRGQSFHQIGVTTDNNYESMALHLSETLGYPSNAQRRKTLNRISRERERLESAITELKEQLKSAHKEEEKQQSGLQTASVRQWPELASLSTEGYQKMTEQDTGKVAAWLAGQQAFQQLTRLQDELDGIEDRLLDLDRELGMHMRAIRLFELSRLFELLYRFGSNEDINAFEELQACERWSPSQQLDEAQ